ncbi:ClpXP protease specificity-enhancing factor [Kangiella sp. TOML190]|uniref:ClpXP protease specificity-enhancing factor n=1 Tax=Kangiella sp. TOML190 TaxID=2931351 RepID=UPI0020407ACF|nr:ClpXP protease specificity-enhancing factor [Kangiella sp. TOML190]
MATRSPLQPYLLIAYYEWMLDNDWTPQILVDASHPQVDIPKQFANDGKIVLNIAPSAVGDFHMGHEAISFKARFSGSSLNIYVPMNSILAIYTRENDKGIMFSPDMYEGDIEGDDPNDEPPKPKKGKPSLKVVK